MLQATRIVVRVSHSERKCEMQPAYIKRSPLLKFS